MSDDVSERKLLSPLTDPCTEETNVSFKIGEGGSPRNSKLGTHTHTQLNDITRARVAPPMPQSRSMASGVSTLGEYSVLPQEDRDQFPSVTATINADTTLTVNANDQMLVELYDLSTTSGEWKETARWIKYEEDVEGMDSHWGQPHVAFLFYDNVYQLRQCISKGHVFAEVSIEKFDDLTTMVVDAIQHDIKEGCRDQVESVLKLRHSHAACRSVKMHSSQSAAPAFYKQHHGNMTSTQLNHIASQPTIPHSHNTKRASFLGALPKFSVVSMLKSRSGAHLGGENLKLESTESAQIFVGEIPALSCVHFIMIRMLDPVLFEEALPIPTRYFFFIIGPPHWSVSYHELGRSLGSLLANPDFKPYAVKAMNGADLQLGLDKFLHGTVLIPPGGIDSKKLIPGDLIKKAVNKRINDREEQEKDYRERAETERDAVRRERLLSLAQQDKPPFRPFRGLVDDIRARLPYYKSDFVDALNPRCIASILFMVLASLAPAITFGGLMGTYTDNEMGMLSTLYAQCLCGVVWSLFSAQPLIIMSATGPVLIFEKSLYTMCAFMSLDFMTVRLYAGGIICLISFITVAFEGSRLLQYVTKFTEDIFNVLISLIFITEVGKFLIDTVRNNPIESFDYYVEKRANCTALLETDPSCAHLPEPNTALLTAAILVATFAFALSFKLVRESKWFGKFFRNIFGDYGVAIAITVVAFLVHYTCPHIELARLSLPQAGSHGIRIITPKHTEDSHISLILAAIAAALVFILLFVESQITELLLMRRGKLEKGGGYNWDLLLVGILALVCSVFGLPWMCAAAVQSLAHSSSLTVVEKNAPGQRDGVVSVIEQRVTGMGVSLIVGSFAFFGHLLRVPMASLFGVFLYLGVMNMKGSDLLRRFTFFFRKQKHYPSHLLYTQQVTFGRMHMYTLIQIVLLIAIFACKQFSATAIAFPFILILFVVIRQLVLPEIYSEKELVALDGEEEEDEEDDDFYNSPIPI